MVCRYCNTLLPDTSIYCCTCGRKQLLVPRPRHRPRAHSEGSIVRLSGKRRCPYWARGPAEYNGRSVHRPSLGCYATYAAAAEALGRAKYCGSPESSPKQTTLRDIYNHFVDTHYYAELSRSAQSSHRTAWGHLAPCADTPIDVVNKQTFQLPIDELARKGLKRETLAKIRNLCSLL